MRIYFLFLAVLSLAGCQWIQKDVLVADFEGDTYGDWTVEGTAFGHAPARGTLPGQNEVTGYMGAGLANSFVGADKAVGKLTSPPFRIRRNYINFLVGGGEHPNKTCINLLIDGKTVLSTTGSAKNGSDTERLDWESWDVSVWKGKDAVIEIVDRQTGGWGHISVDQVVQSNEKWYSWNKNVTREMMLDKDFLLFPVKTNGSRHRVNILVDHVAVRTFDIELADDVPDFWVSCNVSGWKGKKAAIHVDRIRKTSSGLETVTTADSLTAPDMYHEQHRPLFHFTAKRGWLNDPNGLVYHNGTYHLFFQHNPYGVNWGNMHWGHATSNDLVHWRHRDEALYPHDGSDMTKCTAYSGSAAADKRNTTGFGTAANPPLVIAYTAYTCGQWLAYSLDNGKTFTRYDHPVLAPMPESDFDERDPKIFWHDASQQWVMALWVGPFSSPNQGMSFYTSPDLKNWTFKSHTSGFFECPDLFELPVKENPAVKKWVLYGGKGAYQIGTFNGERFTPESEKRLLDYGSNYYAAQTFSNIPADDGRTILIPWMRGGKYPDMPFNQQMGFPTELTLHSCPDGLRIYRYPVKEIEKLYEHEYLFENRKIQPGYTSIIRNPGEALDIRCIVDVAHTSEFALLFNQEEQDDSGIPVTFDTGTKRLSCLGRDVTVNPVKNRIGLRILVDKTSVEIFAGEGQAVMSHCFNYIPHAQGIGLYVKDGSLVLEELSVNKLKSIWD